ncbi:hypothetical protein K443DRAFT_91320, partial [Laccaria amethystina LaAM-08-1]
DLHFGHSRPGAYMLPKALFSRERAAHVDELVRARLKEHTAQEQLQQVSAAPGLCAEHAKLQYNIIKTMLDRANKEVSILLMTMKGLEGTKHGN